MQQNKLLKVQQVADMLEVCKATVWAYLKSKPEFPRSYQVSAKVTRWKLDEVNAYMGSLASTPS